MPDNAAERVAPKRRMRARTRVAVVLIGLLVAVGFTEIGLRLAGKPMLTFERFTIVGMTGEITTDIAPIRAHPTRWWENDAAPDPRIAEPKPPGTRRIAILGDSVMANIKGTDIPTRLEELLRSQGDEVQVLNFSCLGYSTVQGLRWWREAVRATQPDLVVIAYDWNDLYTPPSIGVGATAMCSDVHWSRRVDWESTRNGLLLFDALTSPEPVLQRVPPTDSALTMKTLFDEIAATGAKAVWVTLPVGPKGPRDGNWARLLRETGHFEPGGALGVMMRLRRETVMTTVGDPLDWRAAWADPATTSAAWFRDDDIHLTPAGAIAAAEFFADRLP